MPKLGLRWVWSVEVLKSLPGASDRPPRRLSATCTNFKQALKINECIASPGLRLFDADARM